MVDQVAAYVTEPTHANQYITPQTSSSLTIPRYSNPAGRSRDFPRSGQQEAHHTFKQTHALHLCPSAD